MKFKEGLKRGCVFIASLVLLACPGSSSVGSGSDQGAAQDLQICTPGETGDCFTCENSSSSGLQTCNEEGSAWGACECLDVPVQDAVPSKDIVLVAPDEGQEPPTQIVTVPIRVHVVKSSTVLYQL